MAEERLTNKEIDFLFKTIKAYERTQLSGGRDFYEEECIDVLKQKLLGFKDD